MSRCDVWLLLLLAQTGTASVLTESILSELNSSYWRPQCLHDYLTHVSTRHLAAARQVFVLSEADETGHRTEMFLAGFQFPRFVATSRDHNMADCDLPIDTFFIFLEDPDDGILAEFLARLPRCWIRARFVVVFPERWRLSKNEHRQLQDLFHLFWLLEAADVVAVLPCRDAVRVFTFFPHKERCHLAGSPVQVDQWPRVAGEFPSVEIFPHVKVTSLHGCTVRLTAIHLAPDVITEPRISEETGQWAQHVERTQILKHSLDGIEVRLINALACKMNFSAVFAWPSDGSNWGYVRGNGTLTGMIADINNNLSDVGFGHVTHNTQYVGFLEYSTSLGIDCYGWGLPLGAGQQPPAWVMFTTEFSSLTWGLIFMSLLVAAVVLWILPRALPRWEQRDSKLYMPSSAMFYASSTVIAAPVWMRPSSQPVRMFVVFWLLYCIVVNVAYQAEMGSIMTVPWGPINIRNLEELMESGLNLKAHWKILETLRKSSDDPVIGEVMSRLQPVTTVTELVDKLQSQDKRNFAYLMYRRSLDFYASQSGWKFHVMSESCMMCHHTALVVRRGSPFVPRMNAIIQQLIDAGIVNKWVSDFTPRSPGCGSVRSGLSLRHLLGAYMILALGLLLAVASVLTELGHRNATAAPLQCLRCTS